MTRTAALRSPRAGVPGRVGPRARRGRGRREGSPDRGASRRDPQRLRGPRRREEGRRRVRLRIPRLRGRPRCAGPGGLRPGLAASPDAADLASALDQWAFLRGGGSCTTRSARRGSSRWPERPIRTPGGIACETRSAVGTAARPASSRVLERLAATADVEHLPVASVTRLAASLAFLGRRETAIALLRRAQSSHRDDFWVNADLGAS